MKKDAENMNGKRRSATRALYARVATLVAPVSYEEDIRQRELILNVILVFSIGFLAILDAMVGYNTLRIPWYYGISFVTFTLILISYVWMFLASKRGYAKPVSYILIGIYAAGSIYGGWIWGASLPATLLMFALVSAVSGILIGSRFGFFVSLALVAVLALLGIHEIRSLGVESWKYETINATDVILYGAIILFIAGVSWLSNRELEKSLRRARESEKLLAAERNLLEIKVAERTEELRQSQAKRMAELSRIAEFGKLARGLFHDLMSPLSSVALHMERLDSPSTRTADDAAKIRETRIYVKKAVAASEKMGSFMENIRRQMREDSPKKPGFPSEESAENPGNMTCDIGRELESVIELLAYKAREAGVTIMTETDGAVSHDAHPHYFRQIFQNLISNAIEAFSDPDSDASSHGYDGYEKIVRIKIGKSAIAVWNNGPTIAPENLPKIFEAFFTTKDKRHNSGIGLHTVKSIVEKKLTGKITVASEENTGTTFTIDGIDLRQQ